MLGRTRPRLVLDLALRERHGPEPRLELGVHHLRGVGGTQHRRRQTDVVFPVGALRRERHSGRQDRLATIIGGSDPRDVSDISERLIDLAVGELIPAGPTLQATGQLRLPHPFTGTDLAVLDPFPVQLHHDLFATGSERAKVQFTDPPGPFLGIEEHLVRVPVAGDLDLHQDPAVLQEVDTGDLGDRIERQVRFDHVVRCVRERTHEVGELLSVWRRRVQVTVPEPAPQFHEPCVRTARFLLGVLQEPDDPVVDRRVELGEIELGRTEPALRFHIGERRSVQIDERSDPGVPAGRVIGGPHERAGETHGGLCRVRCAQDVSGPRLDPRVLADHERTTGGLHVRTGLQPERTLLRTPTAHRWCGTRLTDVSELPFDRRSGRQRAGPSKRSGQTDTRQAAHEQLLLPRGVGQEHIVGHRQATDRRVLHRVGQVVDEITETEPGATTFGARGNEVERFAETAADRIEQVGHRADAFTMRSINVCAHSRVTSDTFGSDTRASRTAMFRWRCVAAAATGDTGA